MNNPSVCNQKLKLIRQSMRKPREGLKSHDRRQTTGLMQHLMFIDLKLTRDVQRLNSAFFVKNCKPKCLKSNHSTHEISYSIGIITHAHFYHQVTYRFSRLFTYVIHSVRQYYGVFYLPNDNPLPGKFILDILKLIFKTSRAIRHFFI
jgi:hypothetical protein